MAATSISKKILARQHEIYVSFLREIDCHLADLLAGRATELFVIRDLARVLCLHPTHLNNTVKLVAGHSLCHFFQLRTTNQPVAAVAATLTYDPANFTKFFKRFAGGITPKQYCEQVRAEQRELAETLTN